MKITNYDYWKEPIKPYPKRVNWRVIAGSGLSPLQQYDLIFDEYDLRIRKML